MAILAIDIGGTNTRTGIFVEPGRCIGRGNAPNRRLGEPVAVDAFLAYVGHQLELAKRAGKSIDAIGVAAAAVVDPITGYVHVAENIGWRDLPLGNLLEKQFNLPVQIDTDAFCGALAEGRLGAGVDWHSFLYITIGTGIGHGFVLERKVWHGAHCAANVFGHMKVAANGEPCYCGGHGCLCMYASGDGIARLGRRSQVDRQGLMAKDVIHAAAQGERWAVQITDQAIEYLTIALSSVYNLMDIEGVVLDGGAVSALYPNLTDLCKRLEDRIYPAMNPPLVRRGKLGGESVLQGAALLAFDAV